MNDDQLALLDSLANSPWAAQLTMGTDETPDGTPTAVARDVIRWAVAEIARLRLTDAEREAVEAAAEAYGENDDDPECERIATALHGLWQRTAQGIR